VRLPFRDIPDPRTGSVRPRPIVDVVVDGLDIAPQACLLDSGATAVRFGGHVADICGIDLQDARQARLAVGGAVVTALMAEVTLEIDDGLPAARLVGARLVLRAMDPFVGLLGLTGFFDQFTVTIAAYEEWFELTPRT
jgi:hypothetical protein